MEGFNNFYIPQFPQFFPPIMPRDASLSDSQCQFFQSGAMTGISTLKRNLHAEKYFPNYIELANASIISAKQEFFFNNFSILLALTFLMLILNGTQMHGIKRLGKVFFSSI